MSKKLQVLFVFVFFAVIGLALFANQYAPAPAVEAAPAATRIVMATARALDIREIAPLLPTQTVGDHRPTLSFSSFCIPYTRAMVVHSPNGFSHTSFLTHGQCVAEKVKKAVRDVIATITAAPTHTYTSTPDAPTSTPEPTQPPVVTKTPEPTQPPATGTPAPKPTDTPAPTAEATKQKCNKGKGNGSEGCDPGNHPEKGNDDEPTMPNASQTPVK